MNIDKLRRIMMGLCIFFAFMAFTTGHLLMCGVAIVFAIGIKYVYSGSYDERNAKDKRVDNAGDLTIDEIYEAIKDIETPIGKAYIGGHDKFGNDVIIIGPGLFKDYVVIYKDKNSILIHTSSATQHLKVDESRFDDVLDTKNLAVTTKRFSSFVSYKVICSVLIIELKRIIENLKKGIMPAEKELLKFNMFHYDSYDDIVKDIHDNEYAICDTIWKPFDVKVYNMDKELVSEVIGDKNEMKKGFQFVISGEPYGIMYSSPDNGTDRYVMSTPDGEFTATAFRAVEDGRINCNYRVRLDGVDKAIIIGSKKVEFEVEGFIENDVICSFDDDFLLVYVTMLESIMAINRVTRH